MAEETRVIYHLEDQETPYLIRIGVPTTRVTLADFKQALSKPNVKFFFKSVDDDFGVVKEEISDDDTLLPCVNGRVICWVVSSDTCTSDFKGSDIQSVATPSSVAPPPIERTGGIGDSRPPSFHAAAVSRDDSHPSVVSASEKLQGGVAAASAGGHLNGHVHQTSDEVVGPVGGGDSSSTQQSSELETTSFCSSEEDSGGRFSQSTKLSSLSPRLIRRQRRRHRKPKESRMERSVSFSSVTDSTMSLNIVTVTLNMERYNFLGISIVGQSNDRGDGGIYIGSIVRGGAVAADGRIEPGDMLLQVNDINFENMSNDDAVRVLRDVVHQPGPVTLTVAKCWDPNPRGCFTLPRSEPVRPIDPAAWVSHTAAMTGRLLPHYSVHEDQHLNVHSDMTVIVKAMANPESGLEVRDRMWLKITIANAVIGADVVDWLYSRVEGFKDRRDARKYASSLLKHGYLRHTVNKITFSEQCYYTFGDLCQNMASLNLNEGSSGGGSEQDTLAPLPPTANPWPLGGQPFPYPPFPSAPPSFPPGYSDPCHSFHSGSAGSQHSEGSRSSGSNSSAGKDRRSPQERCQRTACSEPEPGVRGGRRGDRSASQMSHHSHALSSHSHARSSLSHRSPSFSQNNHPPFTYSHAPFAQPSPGSCAQSERSHASSYGPPGLPPPYCLARLAPKTSVSSSTPPGAPPGRELAAVPPELTASRQSFQHAMGNPCEFFVDIM
uniref:Dishevelled, dsh homolog 3 n=3 Tax=Nothobranchius furzeri TaxID=105023 RepID=A0A1A8UP36_NOTFU